VQLWLPVLAIVNLYMNVQAIQYLRGMDLYSTGISTPADMIQFWTQSLEWIGTAGMLAAATPALTFMLIFGGAYSAQALAGRLQGGDHTNEKVMAPDAVTPGAVVAQSSQMNWSPATGLVKTGYESNQTQISMGGMVSRDERSTYTEAQAKNASLSEMISQTMGASYTTGRSGSIGGNSSDSTGSSTNSTFGSSRGDATGTGTSVTVGTGAARSDATIEEWSLGGKLGAGGSADTSTASGTQRSGSVPTGTPVDSSSSRKGVRLGFDLSGGVSGSQVGTDSRSNTTSSDASRNNTATVALQNALQAGNSKSVAAALVAAYNDSSTGVAQALQENKALATAYQDAVSANASHAEMSAISESSQASRSISLSHAGEQILNSLGPNAGEGLRHMRSQAIAAFGSEAVEDARKAAMREGVNGGRVGPATDAAAFAYLAANANGRSDIAGSGLDDDFRRQVYQAMGFGREPLSHDDARRFDGVSERGPAAIKDLTFAPGTGDPGLSPEKVKQEAIEGTDAAKRQVLWTREQQEAEGRERFGEGGVSAVMTHQIFEKAALGQEAERNLLNHARTFDVNGAEYARSFVEDGGIGWPRPLGGDVLAYAYDKAYGGYAERSENTGLDDIYRGQAHAVAQNLFPDDAQKQLAVAGYIMSDEAKGNPEYWNALPANERAAYEEAMRAESDQWFSGVRAALDEGQVNAPISQAVRGTSDQSVGSGSPVAHALPSEPPGGLKAAPDYPPPVHIK
jgi:hypothetical protein